MGQKNETVYIGLRWVYVEARQGGSEVYEWLTFGVPDLYAGAG